jgi:mRNA-degrading endonuclease RelE of RelBE toxin-antitoxin system
MSYIVNTTQSFRRDVKQLHKKYKKIALSIKPLISKLENGELEGNKVPNVDALIFKVRISNKDLHGGKQGGFRVIYYVLKNETIYLMAIYAKTTKENINSKEINNLLKKIEL